MAKRWKWKMQAKTKKWVLVGAIVAGVALVAGLIGGLSATKKKLKVAQQEKPIEIDGKLTLNEWVFESTKDLKLKLTDNVRLAVNEDGETILSTESTPNITVDGNGRTVKVTGAVKGAIKAYEGGTLTFQNVKFIDDTTGGVYSDYLGFGGNVCFENCTFTSSIYLLDDADASFKNCSIKVSETERYAIWIADGSASFTSCFFEGTRGLKIHEKGTDDVVAVSVEKCTFNKLSEKPGVVIGEIVNKPMETSVSICNSRFIDCYAWDKVGSIAGVDGCFETDTKTDAFDFVLKNNTVQFTPSAYKVAYYGMIDGEEKAIPTAMYKENGSYPTEYESASGATIDDLQDYGYYEFNGWYLDKACKKPFSGSISAGYTGKVKMYAKIVDIMNDIYWTPNY